ncbi:hypothetical protein PF005_g20398 [Phytophthora fragariae]|nr:hypothetical protein PF003_g32144 [Phytophthora fragariae]KAE8928534.1 hypothetical protein PF009_g21331 [Phytophthora fragariae]KAE8988695.1 hypothetical protein PF011_g19065 [Phytophthora fragariae]KAE9083995.1 hypothetical protein PF007_g21680 [Phytophthora fragariae]KAE9084090.1 hypothetical protein PF010_g20971 [Phytophthora fragariae]
MRDEMNQPRTQLTSTGPRISKTEARMKLLERAVLVSMPRITQAMVQRMELHAAKFVIAATCMEDMSYGA